MRVRACVRMCGQYIHVIYTSIIHLYLTDSQKNGLILCKEIRKLNLEGASKNAPENVSKEANIRNSVDPETE